MPESFIATVQKLRRVAIPPNISKLYNIKEGDQVRVTVELVSSVQTNQEEKQ
jgi:bifunctional DNA-binding transcriptional regulator/antitoxin component of YhaV-PrlF toxin-antitoxin module